MTQAFHIVPLSRMSDSTVKPKEYVNFAIRDLAENEDRAFVNAIGNIKRAIDSQFDILLESYGLLNQSIKKKWSFPRKIDIIRKIGIISPRILKLINSTRVQLEHYHNITSKEKIFEHLAIAELFVELFKSLKTRKEVLIDYANDFAVWIDTKENTILVFDNIERIRKLGGIKLLRDNVKNEKLSPIQSIPIYDIDSWTEACGKYIRN